MKTTLIWIALIGFALWALWRAWKAAKAQIAADQSIHALGDPDLTWRGAERFGGGFEKEPLPDEKTIRATWSCIHMGEQVSSFVKGAEGPPDFDPRKLAMLCKWCDTTCEAAWMATLLEKQQLTFWFEKTADAQAFALAWTPRRTM